MLKFQGKRDSGQQLVRVSASLLEHCLCVDQSLGFIHLVYREAGERYLLMTFHTC